MTNTLDIDDQVVEDAYKKGYINQWECSFMMGRVNFATLSDKQETKMNLILKKMLRGVRQEQAKANKPAQAVAKAAKDAAAHALEHLCPHCGKPMDE